MQVKLQGYHLLTDVVVQLAGEIGAFRFLSGEQPAAQVSDSFEAAAQLRLRPTSSGALNEKAGD